MIRRTPIRRVSKKRAAQLRVYSKLRKEFLEKNNYCEVCGWYATDLHHKAGRIGDKLNDKTKFMALCRFHHDWIHSNPSKARNLGWLE